MPFRKFLNKASMKILVAMLAILLTVNTYQSALATELPPEIVEYITKTYPGANIRFDGLIELSDGTIYIPVLPVSYEESSEPAKITMKIPENSERPDLILFADNLSLLKIIKNEKGERTLISGDSVPLKVKLGLLPQDLVVPDGLIIPPDLGSIVGDLVVSSNSVEPPKLSSNNSTNNNSVNNQSSNSPFVNNAVNNSTANPDNVNQQNAPNVTSNNTGEPVFKPLHPTDNNNLTSDGVNTDTALNNRRFYIISVGGNKVYSYDPVTSQVLSSIEVGSLPSGTVLTPDAKKLYVVCMGSNSLVQVNTNTYQIDNAMKVGHKPLAIAVSPDGSKLYITNSGSGTVSVINTENFETIGNIEIQGIPAGIVASKDNESFYMFNKSSGIVSKWNALKPEERHFLFMIKNPHDIAVDAQENKLYVISRTNNSLMIYNLPEKKYEAAVNVGNKPTAVRLSSDEKYIYTLDSGDDKISVIDNNTYQILKTIDLATGGFPSGLTIIPKTNIALITNAESDQVAMVDLDAGRVIKTIPVGITSKSLIVSPLPSDIPEKITETPKAE